MVAGQIATKVAGTRWELIDAEGRLPVEATPLTPQQQLNLLKARARRRAATRPFYPDPPSEAAVANDLVRAARPLQLHVIANLD